MNFIRSKKTFLEELRELCTKKKIILIFDEVMTGFRVALGGAQSIYKIRPDLTTLGKVIGGGLPVGAFGGKEEIMNQLAPIGGVYQAGTLSGNPLAMAAGIKTLEIISSNNFFKNLHKKSKFLLDGINNISEKYGKSINVDYQGGMFGIYFTKNNVGNYEDIAKSNLGEFISFFKFMKKNGIFFAPSPYEAGFISSSHSKKDLTKTINTFKNWINNK